MNNKKAFGLDTDSKPASLLVAVVPSFRFVLTNASKLAPRKTARAVHSFWAGGTFALTPRLNDSSQLPPAGETFSEIAFSSQSAFRLWSPVWRMQTRQRFVLVWWTRSKTWATWKPLGGSFPFYFCSLEVNVWHTRLLGALVNPTFPP